MGVKVGLGTQRIVITGRLIWVDGDVYVFSLQGPLFGNLSRGWRVRFQNG